MIAADSYVDNNTARNAKVGDSIDTFLREPNGWVDVVPSKWVSKNMGGAGEFYKLTTVGTGTSLIATADTWVMVLSGSRMPLPNAGSNLVAVQLPNGTVIWESVSEIVPVDGGEAVMLSNNGWYAAGIDPQKGLLIVQ